MVTIAALVAAQLMAAAAPVQASGLPREEESMQPALAGERVEVALADSQAAAERSNPVQDDEPRKKKRKSTGDKILTGAAVVLGVGALAVGGLLVAIFVS
jgi:hypothetical protein